ncbi:hypothetical protein [Stenotrophomonas sp. YIM B06876]|uniref:hypothetical protein n=1 Tax=Stenotrophomonas sp. YIM B06876 TaxID=3060211 RepID=UPI0027398B65|nr:hypothetical protein [Stenotrophomonas sp. YIM B06876]
MLTYYRAGRLAARIFIKLGWAILIAFAILVIVAITGISWLQGGSGGFGMLPGALLGLLPLTFACMATILFGHVALAVFDMADASGKADPSRQHP